MTETQSAISAKALTRKFDAFTAVEQLTFSVSVGEVFGLLGPNGAGKTTTIRMLSALIAPTAGTAWVGGYQIGKADQQIRRNVGVLTETPGLYDALSAEQNLAFYGKMYEVSNLSAQVERYLRMLGLWERRYEPVSTFSKGMRQKLAIARALLHEPKILFLDEPTAGLDPEMAHLIRNFITELRNQGHTIVLCTHNLNEADRLCDRIAVLKTRLLALDTPQALRQTLYGRAVVFHLGQQAQSFHPLVENLPFVQKVTATENKLVVRLENPEERNPEIVRCLVGAGADIQFVGELRHTLEDVYLQLMKTGKEAEHE